MDKIDTIVKIVLHYGVDSQITKSIEEMSELTKELCKYQNGKDNLESIADEIADCEIMLAQLKYIFNCKMLVNQNIEYKLKRTVSNIEKERWKSK